MSEPIETPQAADAAGAGNPDPDPTVSVEVPQLDPTEAGPEDRAEDTRSPEELRESVRAFQSKYDTEAAAHARLQKQLGGLKDWLPVVGGGGGVVALLEHLGSHPDFRQFVNELNQAGKITTPLLPQPKPDEDDAYREPWEEQLEKQATTIAGLEQRLLQGDAARGAETFTSRVQNWLEEYPDLTSEEIERVRERGDATVRRLGHQLTSLSQGDVDTLMVGTFTREEWRALNDRGALRRLQNQQQRGTDSPSPVSITGREGEDLTKSDARDVWAEACRRIQ